MRVESRVTSLSWIPSEAAKDMLRMGLSTHVAEYDDPPHRGGLTCGIRVEDDGVGITYLPDHAPAESSESAESLADDALARSCSDYGPVSIEVGLQGNVLPVIGHRASARREPDNVNDHCCQLGTAAAQADRRWLGISTCHILRLTTARASYPARER